MDLQRGAEMNVFLKFLLSGLVMAIALIPMWLFMLVKHLAAPSGFWQNLVLYGLGIWFLGVVQIILLVFGIILIISIAVVPDSD